MSNKKKILSVFSLVMINVIAVDSIRTLPFSAKFGSGLILYYLVCAICFFIPVALVTAELATTWPKNGGIYIWVKEAFGHKVGFLVIWLQWIYNVVWYPTILGLVAGVLAFLFFPDLSDNNLYTLSIVLSVFYLSTLVNCFGMELSSWVSTIGSILGTLFPMLLIITLVVFWIISGNPIAIKFTLNDLIPKIDSLNDLVLITTILFGLIGLEMSAVHAQDVKNPERDYPKALKISSVIILFTLILSSLAIAIVVPGQELNIVTGILQAFTIFLDKLGMEWMLPILAWLIIIGAVAGVATWIIGPTKGLLAVAKDELLPPWFAKTTSKGSPINILITQSIVVTVLSSAYIFLPTIESAYLILTQLAAILGLLMYILLFAAAIKLRLKYPNIKRPYKIPGGTKVMWLITGVGIATSSFAMFLGFLPPSQIYIGNSFSYQMLLIIGVAVFCVPAVFIHRVSEWKNSII